jgi:hypothetical protein
MNQIEQLQKQWRESAGLHAVRAALSLETHGLMLGTDTVLAKRNHDGALALDGEEARILTLLSVAYGRPVPSSVLSVIHKASRHARAGDPCMASMHLALALPTLSEPLDSARRVFIADGLVTGGVSPRDIWAALDFDSTALDQLEKFDPEQPRVPAGSGRASGQWTSGDSTSSAEVSAAFVGRATAQEAIAEAASEAAITAEAAGETEVLAPLIEAAPRLAGPLAFLAATLWPTPAGGETHFGVVPGRPDLHWSEAEGLLTVTRASDGQFVLQAYRDADGKFRVKMNPGLKRLLNEHADADPGRQPSEGPKATQLDDEPQRCPEPPKPDAPQGSPSSWAYSDYVKALVNEPPTPPKFGYQLQNPFAGGRVVKYDDCQRTTGTMIEFKGPGYARQLRYKKIRNSIRMRWLGQATRQVEASGGRPIFWFFAEKSAFEYARKIFGKYNYLKRIQLVYLPPPENSP